MLNIPYYPCTENHITISMSYTNLLSKTGVFTAALQSELQKMNQHLLTVSNLNHNIDPIYKPANYTYSHYHRRNY